MDKNNKIKIPLLKVNQWLRVPPKSTICFSFGVREVFLGPEQGTLHSAAFDMISQVCQTMTWHHFNHPLSFDRFYQMTLYNILGGTKSLKGMI